MCVALFSLPCPPPHFPRVLGCAGPRLEEDHGRKLRSFCSWYIEKAAPREGSPEECVWRDRQKLLGPGVCAVSLTGGMERRGRPEER